MFIEAAYGVADQVQPELLKQGLLYPLQANILEVEIQTAARVASLKALPPHQFVARTINGRPSYLYADPVVCGCVYVGDQRAYDQYRQQMATQQTATDQQIRAILSTTPLPGEEGLL